MSRQADEGRKVKKLKGGEKWSMQQSERRILKDRGGESEQETDRQVDEGEKKLRARWQKRGSRQRERQVMGQRVCEQEKWIM